MAYADILRNQSINQLLVFLRHKGITLRHLAFGCGILVFLWTSWFTFFSQPRRVGVALPSSAILRPAVAPTKEEWHNRAEQVKAAFVHTYRGYEEHAWGYDEIRPVSEKPVNKCVFHLRAS